MEGSVGATALENSWGFSLKIEDGHPAPTPSAIAWCTSIEEFLNIWGDLVKTDYQSLTDDGRDPKDPSRGGEN